MSTPAQRIGDADRDRAIDLLREHHAAGRLDAAEFDERMSAVLSARTRADLEPLFADLPSGSSDHLPTLSDPPSPTELANSAKKLPSWVMALNGIAWPAAVIACFATNWNYWWIMLIPAVLLPALMGAFAGDDNNDGDDGDKPEALER